MYEVIDNGAEVSIHNINGFKPVQWKASSCGKVECFRHILFTQKSIIIVLRQSTIIANKVEQTLKLKYVLAIKHRTIASASTFYLIVLMTNLGKLLFAPRLLSP
jgi:hypothetical protein